MRLTLEEAIKEYDEFYKEIQDTAPEVSKRAKSISRWLEELRVSRNRIEDLKFELKTTEKALKLLKKELKLAVNIIEENGAGDELCQAAMSTCPYKDSDDETWNNLDPKVCIKCHIAELKKRAGKKS